MRSVITASLAVSLNFTEYAVNFTPKKKRIPFIHSFIHFILNFLLVFSRAFCVATAINTFLKSPPVRFKIIASVAIYILILIAVRLLIVSKELNEHLGIKHATGTLKWVSFRGIFGICNGKIGSLFVPIFQAFLDLVPNGLYFIIFYDSLDIIIARKWAAIILLVLPLLRFVLAAGHRIWINKGCGGNLWQHTTDDCKIVFNCKEGNNILIIFIQNF